MKKGSSEWTTVIISFMIVLLLIVVIAPFWAKMTVSLSTNAVIDSSINKYRAHQALAAVRSNDELMNDINDYTVHQEEDLKDSIKSNATFLLSNLTETYTFRIKEKTGDQWNDILYLESDSDNIRRYSSIYVASPSQNPYRIALGVGE